MENIKESLFKEAQRLLRLSPDARTAKDIDTLMEATAEVGFFKQMSHEHLTDEVHRECVRCMVVKVYEASSYIFHYGDPGDCFYIVLRGKISIQMPQYILAADYRNAVETDKAQEPPQTTLKTSKSDKKTAETNAQEADRRDTESNSDLNALIEVKVKGEGTAFGELALLTDSPRAASIQCLTDSWIAKLSRGDFLRILKEYESKKIREMVRFLKTLGEFENWTKHSLVKISYMMELRRYTFNQVVYRYNDPSEHVFLVKSGEFTFTYTIDDNDTPHRHSQFRRVVPRKHFKMFIKGPSEMFGDDEVVESKDRRMTCVCTSLVGEVLVMEKNDFFRRLQVASTWEYIAKRHQAEKLWRTKRIDDLMVAEMLKKRLGEVPDNVRPTHKSTRSVRLSKHSRLENIRCTSVSPAELPTQTTSFFKTEVNDTVESREVQSTTPQLQRPDTPPKVAVREPSRVEGKLKSVHRAHNWSRASVKPPPNFFCSPKEAVLARYKFRHLITGRLEVAMNPIERTFHKRLSRRLKTGKLEKLSEDRTVMGTPLQ
jgi:CRP-like cAMP-binding protein